MNTQLRIDSLTVSNYRCFESLTIDFHPNLTVLVARNGQGKTAILDAIKVALGTFTNSFPYSAEASFSSLDAHFQPDNEPQYPISVSAKGARGEQSFHVIRELEKAKGRTDSNKAGDLTTFGNTLFNQTKKDSSNADSINLPILAFYGTGRLWSGKKYTVKDDELSPLADSRFLGYDSAFFPNTNYKFVKQWLMEAIRFIEETREDEVQNSVQYKNVKEQLSSVRNVLGIFLALEGLGGLHYNRFLKDLAIFRRIPYDANMPEDLTDAYSIALPVSCLSDGVRAVFATVADIASRCAKLNRHLGKHAHEETNGIVMIDEVDLFLHPAWQQRIIGDLQRSFPNIQFILTTHSPQVISSVPRESVRILDNGKVVDPSIATDGARADQILKEIFGVDARYKGSSVSKALSEYQELIKTNQWDSEQGKALYDIIRKALPTDPVLAELDMQIFLKEYQRRHSDEKNK